MPTRKEIEEQIAALTAELENADTDDEVWVKEGSREFRISGRRATSILARFEDLWKADNAGAGDQGTDGAEGGETGDEGLDDPKVKQDKKPDGGGGYFRGRK